MPHNLNIVLVEPKIHGNTGSIGRLCLATGSTLHLIEPLGFEINDKQLKRAGLDYWKHVQVVIHKDLKTFFESIPEDSPKAFFSTKAETSYFDHQFQAGSYLFFGSETEGFSEELKGIGIQPLYRIPLYDDRVRSLNLANAVSIVVYEAIRQLGP
ncbi:MAG: tRNA (cytidine(34)-2'-O)-methyltransferase [Nitrospinae bacterium]|jgi:tRNA (cytidine/uridine-2'-O-)-methyltransferase|nr:tRNA (cytidine(34)-2'-O)-methyltransferase [Nitrospinota bacterium]MDA1110628.1 tRNA (cytidine(34)-2'-O)-methyltransferase [Nitrospinota bacterium]